MLRFIAVAATVVLLCPRVLLAIPTEVISADVPNCDLLVVPEFVHELGLAPLFPDEERIDAISTLTQDAACPSDDPLTPNALVVMTNLSPIAWSDVWYVADPFDDVGGVGTSISNFDGFVDGIAAVFAPGEAFKIDRVGINVPLVFESMTPDGIFEIGETWHFIIDDYMNSGGLVPELFDSIGVGSLSAGGPPSSGSIIAIPVPEPTGIVLAAMAFVALACWSRRRPRQSVPRSA